MAVNGKKVSGNPITVDDGILEIIRNGKCMRVYKENTGYSLWYHYDAQNNRSNLDDTWEFFTFWPSSIANAETKAKELAAKIAKAFF